MEITLEQFKKMAKSVTQDCKENRGGENVKLSSVLEAMSRALGYRNFNTLRPHLVADKSESLSVIKLYAQELYSSFFVNATIKANLPQEAVCLVGAARKGKTEALLSAAKLLLSPSNYRLDGFAFRVLYFDMSGSIGKERMKECGLHASLLTLNSPTGIEDVAKIGRMWGGYKTKRAGIVIPVKAGQEMAVPKVIREVANASKEVSLTLREYISTMVIIDGIDTFFRSSGEGAAREMIDVLGQDFKKDIKVYLSAQEITQEMRPIMGSVRVIEI